MRENVAIIDSIGAAGGVKLRDAALAQPLVSLTQARAVDSCMNDSVGVNKALLIADTNAVFVWGDGQTDAACRCCCCRANSATPPPSSTATHSLSHKSLRPR